MEFEDKSSCLTANTANLTIGKKGGSHVATFFTGAIDELNIYNYALSESKIDRLCNGGTGEGQTTGIDESINSPNVSIFPNPTKGGITIASVEVMEEIQIYNTNSQLVYSNGNLNVKSIELDLSKYVNGIYILLE
ncbi:MAG: T9SS type A sorting domain-containing protein [Flavobacteriales bacterium]|nr:T9SS type A sorting domain-containing protein [Flavobacteriales bacterium]